MEYTEFCEKVKATLQGMVGDTAFVRLEEVVKNNHIVRRAVIIAEKGKNISPSVYLENYYADYLNGRNLSDVCVNIMVLHERYKDGIDFNIEEYMDYNTMRDKLYVKVVNRDKNELLLKNVPWREYYDLAMIVYVMLEEVSGHRATINVGNKNLSIWGVDSDTLFEDAIRNTKESMELKIEKLSAIMKEIVYEKFYNCGGEDSEELENALRYVDEMGDGGMYVLTNKCKTNGAVIIAFNEVLGQVSDRINDDMYILPSSIHELLVVPKKSGVTRVELENMVREINNTEVDPGEVLSDTVYEYHRNSGVVW